MEFRDLKRQYQALKPEIDTAISTVLANTDFISGNSVKELEKHLAEYVGVKHCITCGNGTDALILALMTWGIGKGDAVFVPDFTFFASAEAPALCGATPVFIDVEKDTFNLSPNSLETSIKEIIKEGLLTPRVIIAVDLFGQPADYGKIRDIAQKYELLILEDSAQGFGGSIHSKKACSFGDISTTSFFPAKPLGCYGDGGAVFTDNDKWAELIRSYAVHGKNAGNKYDNIRIGLNSRLDTVQAAILLVKLNAFKKYELNAVKQAADWYRRALEDSEMILPNVREGFVSSYAQFTIRLPEGLNRENIIQKLNRQGIPTMVYYRKPMHMQSAFLTADYRAAACPTTEKLCQSVLSLPIHPYLKKEEVEYVAKSIC